MRSLPEQFRELICYLLDTFKINFKALPLTETWGNSGDGCELASTLCRYDLMKGALYVLGWARVRRVRLGSISSELIMCGGGMRSILYCLLWLDA